jgi:siroheme synthase (precorrin-2 oxidase/ferrochelatase)
MTNRFKIVLIIGTLHISSASNFAMVHYVPSWATKENAILALAIATPITVPIVHDFSSNIIESLFPKGMGRHVLTAIPLVIAWAPFYCIPDNIQFNKRRLQGNQRGSRWWYAAPGITAAALGLAQYYRNCDVYDLIGSGLLPSVYLIYNGYQNAQLEIRLEAREHRQREEAERRVRARQLREQEEREEAIRLQQLAEEQRQQQIARDKFIKQIGREYLHQAMLQREEQQHFEIEQLQKQTDQNNRLTQDWQPEIATEDLGY